MGLTQTCIAVVEDERSLRADLVEYLRGCGYLTVGCEDGKELDKALAEHPIDIIILDVNLPGESGFAIAGRLRKGSKIGIIMLTARGPGVDRVIGLELGADAYLVKPVDLREVEAQIRALVRRLEPGPHRPDEAPTGVWVYDQLAWNLISPDGVAIKLTGNERTFVSLLVAHPGETVARHDIYVALGKPNWDPMGRSVDSMVRRLRAKGGQLTGTSMPIEAAHGAGYVFTAPAMTR